MVIEIDFNSDEAIYMQITNQIIMGIATSRLHEGGYSAFCTAACNGIVHQPEHIQRAYMQLEQEGLIYPVKGKGNFIADSEEVRKISKASYTEELKTLIRKGKAMGMEAEELIYIIRECYKEEKP